MANVPFAAIAAKRRSLLTTVVVEFVLAAATLLLLLALFTLVACAPAPLPAPQRHYTQHRVHKPTKVDEASAVPLQQMSADTWCSLFEYREGSDAWSQCIARWRRNLVVKAD
jgi:hypothetical protein